MITAYVGKPGTGKTYQMSRDLCAAMDRGIEVWANYALRGAHYFERMEEVANVNKGIVAVDELNTWMPASKWQSVPISQIATFTQSRHEDLDMFYSTQSFRKVVSDVRLITTEVWRMGWVVTPKFKPDDRYKKPMPWRYRWHTADLYDADDIENGYKRIKPKRHLRFWENSKIYRLYNTKFRIRTPRHLLGEDAAAEDFDPTTLPVFGDDLTFTPETRYVCTLPAAAV
jgi:hypothetical protein